MKKDAKITGKIIHYQSQKLRVLTSIKGKGRSIPIDLTLPQNQHKCSNAPNTFGQ
jgi:hypothetical protein